MKKEKAIRVLMVFGEPFSFGGQESFALNMYKFIDKAKVKIDFYTPFIADNQAAIDLLKSNGSELFHSDYLFDSNRKAHFVQGVSDFLKINAEKYDIAHINSGSTFNLLEGAKIAKKYGIKKVIVHSHATGLGGIKYRLIKTISDLSIRKYADLFAACSKEAGAWKFPKSILKSDDFFVIKNGVDIERFSFNKKIRDEVREKLGVENKSVLLNVGRFSPEKNQLFLLDVFANYKEKNQNAFLIIIGGDGGEKENITNKIKMLGCEDSVLVLGGVPDVYRYMQAADVFLFPSLYEGLGIVLIEARAAGLPIVCSDAIPLEASKASGAERVPLKSGVDCWANEITKVLEKGRLEGAEFLAKNGYDGRQCAEIMGKIYKDLTL